MGEKLTKAQRAALERMTRDTRGIGLFDGRNRRALHKLYALGLAEFEDARDTGWKMMVHARITDAGRAALQPDTALAQGEDREAVAARSAPPHESNPNLDTSLKG
jgi:hypothetical protein